MSTSSRVFTGTAVTESVASWSGLLDRRTRRWDEPLLALLSVGMEHFSALTDVRVPRRGLVSPFSERWPALRDVPWFPAVGDGAAANVGSGCVTPGRVALTVGTTAALGIVKPDPVDEVPWGLWCYRVDGRRCLPGGALSEGGSVLDWARRMLRLPDPPALDDALARAEPDGQGLTVLPYLAGERSPGWQGGAKAVVPGIRPELSSPDSWTSVRG